MCGCKGVRSQDGADRECGVSPVGKHNAVIHPHMEPQHFVTFGVSELLPKTGSIVNHLVVVSCQSSIACCRLSCLLTSHLSHRIRAAPFLLLKRSLELREQLDDGGGVKPPNFGRLGRGNVPKGAEKVLSRSIEKKRKARNRFTGG